MTSPPVAKAAILPRKKAKKYVPPIPKPRSVRFMSLLQGRELGSVPASNFPGSALQMKIQDYARIRTCRFGSTEEILHTNYFVRAGKNALIGAWYVRIKNNKFVTVVAQLHYDLSRVKYGQTAYVTSDNTILDACQLTADPDCFVCVGNDLSKCTGEVQIATGSRRHNNQYNVFKYKHPYSKPFWCCNGNSFREKIAIGCDRQILLYSATGMDESRNLLDNIYAVAYNENGTVLHLGTEKGEFFSYDLRARNSTSRVLISTNIVDDILRRSDENYCIVSGVTGSLKEVDLRVRKVVHEFQSHDRRSRRIPVSVNERYGLLCSSGADDVTRLWCLKSAKLLHSFSGPNTYPARSCLVPDCPRALIHLLQDNFIHVYCMLR